MQGEVPVLELIADMVRTATSYKMQHPLVKREPEKTLVFEPVPLQMAAEQEAGR